MASNDAARTLTGKVALARVVEVFAGPLGAVVSGQALRVDGGGPCWPGGEPPNFAIQPHAQ